MAVITLPTWEVDGWTANTVDDGGVRWFTSSPDGTGVDSGWFDPPGVRLSHVERIGDHGVYRSRNWRTSRVIVLKGKGKAPTVEAAGRAIDRFNSLLWHGGQSTLTVTEPDGGIRTARVELGDKPQLMRLTSCTWEWQLVLIASDPRKYGAERSASTSLPLPGTGLDWQTGGGLDWQTGGGLDWGTPASNGAMVLTNAGTVETWPRHRIDGPLVQGDPDLINPMISLSSGQRLVYTGTLAFGDWLIIDTHPSRRSVLLNGTARRRHLLTVAQWAPLPPGDVTVAFSADSQSPSARLTTYWSPAVA